MVVWLLWVLYVLGFIVFFVDFIVNEKLIYVKLDGELYFLVFCFYVVGFGLDSWEVCFF